MLFRKMGIGSPTPTRILKFESSQGLSCKNGIVFTCLLHTTSWRL